MPSIVSVNETGTVAVTVTPSAEQRVSAVTTAPQRIAVSEPAVKQVETHSTETVSVTELGIKSNPGDKGDKGDKGNDGQDGLSGGFAERNFAIPANVWEFDHELGYIPAVMTYDTSGAAIQGHIVHNTAQRTVVEWYYDIAGSMSVS